jgi:beta-lactamase regulating signal transducer with metallopeptidase domain
MIHSEPESRSCRPGWVRWLIGASGAFCLLLLGRLSLWQIERKATPIVDGPLMDSVVGGQARLKLRRKVVLLQSASCSAPLAAGAVLPRLVLPSGFSSWSVDRQRVVILHELGHIKRRDCLTKTLVWLAMKRIQLDAERACDDLVLGTGADACDYADHVLQIAAGCRRNGLALSSGV